MLTYLFTYLFIIYLFIYYWFIYFYLFISMNFIIIYYLFIYLFIIYLLIIFLTSIINNNITSFVTIIMIFFSTLFHIYYVWKLVSGWLDECALVGACGAVGTFGT